MTDYSDSAAKNPASEATGKSLAALFASDPLDLTPEDRQKIIESFRKQRTEFVTASKKTKKKTSSRRGGQKLEIDLDSEIDI